MRINKNFNPRSRVGNDVYQLPESRETIISIHVPAWGTTKADGIIKRFHKISIHVPAWGTTVIHLYEYITYVFQSTFPRGERPSSKPSRCRPGNFNPRSRVGNDLSALGASPVIHISIHVPAWGTTDQQSPVLSRPRNFNPRSRVGNDEAGGHLW